MVTGLHRRSDLRSPSGRTGIWAFPVVFLAAVVTATAEDAPAGHRADSGNFSISIPGGPGWRIETDPDRVLLTRDRSSGGHRIGTSAILVLRSRPRDSECGLPADQTASDYCDREEFELWVNGQITGLFGVSGVHRETVSIGGKTLYAMHYRVEFSEDRGGARTENRMYIYFPPAFQEDNYFYVFMQTEACLPHHCEGHPGPVDETPLREVIGSLQIAAEDARPGGPR